MPHRLLAGIAVLAMVACAGEGAPGSDADAAPAADNAVAPVAREPLTEADLLGLALADLSLEVPWTQNRVTRDPAPSQGPGWLESVDVSSGEGFARVLFTFSDIAFYPGYDVRFLEAGAEIPCGEEGKPLSVSGDRALVIRFRPATAHGSEGVKVPVRTSSLSPEAFTEGGLVCDANDNVVWVAGLNSGDEVRLLELGKPRRLAVDLR